MSGHLRQTRAVYEAQLELFQVEVALGEFQKKQKELKARLIRLGAGKKTCTKCKEELDIEYFRVDRQKTDKRCSWCDECQNKAGRERYYRMKARAA
jgi:hypothetical protein